MPKTIPCCKKVDDQHLITIDKLLLKQDYTEGLFLNLEELIQHDADTGKLFKPVKKLSTSQVFIASEDLVEFLKQQDYIWPEKQSKLIGLQLQPTFFCFERDESKFSIMLQNLHEYMPWVVTSGNPMLSAAEINVQIEFDKAYRSIVLEESYHGKNLIYISGLNIDYSPNSGQHFPLSHFVPWAAYIQKADGTHYILEQDALYEGLMDCSDKNEDQVRLDKMIWD